MSGMTVEELRQELPMTGELAYFQTGSYGPATDSVLEVVREVMTTEAHHGPATPSGRRSHIDRETAARTGLARLLNVLHEELAITTNTSRAMQQVIRGIRWQPGDEFIMSSLEHVSTYGVYHELEQEYGVRVKVIAGEQGDKLLLERLANAITDNTRLVCLSHIASPDGRLLPVREAAGIAHERSVPIVVDLAQSVGQIPVDLSTLDCDFAVGSGHKWLLGPMGTGFLFVSAGRIPSFRPNFIPDYSPWTTAGAELPPITARSRGELGTYNHALVVGLGKAVKIAESVGLASIQARAAHLTRLLRNEVSKMNGVRIITPLEDGKSAGITSLMFDGFTNKEMTALVDRLHSRQKAIVKAQWLTAPPDPVKIAMRVSIACFNNEEEVDRLLEGIEEGLRAGTALVPA